MGIRYNPALDGVRALAVVTVVAGHYGLPRVDEFHGVTVFFVLSGYLITSLLLAEQDLTGGLDLRAFYRRRFARLTPALVVVVATTAVGLLAADVPISTWWAGAASALTYSGDATLGLDGAGHVSGWFLWSWSLAIEEQFYLLWPCLLLLLIRRWPERSWPGVLVIAIALAWVLRRGVFVVGARHEAWLFGPQTHVDALLWGALVAVILRRHSRRIAASPVTGVVGVVGVVGLLVLDHVTTGGFVPGLDVAGFGQSAVAAALLILCVGAVPDGALARALRATPLRFLGKISYSVYLWNISVFAVFDRLTGAVPAQSPWGWTSLVALGVMASLSWRYVEMPLRARWSVSARGGSPASPSSTSELVPSAAGCSSGSRPAPSTG